MKLADLMVEEGVKRGLKREVLIEMSRLTQAEIPEGNPEIEPQDVEAWRAMANQILDEFDSMTDEEIDAMGQEWERMLREQSTNN